VAAYTPVYYFLAAALQALFGSTFLPGRALSFASGIAAAALVGFLTARRAQSRWAGAVAALLFLTLGFPGRFPFYALYKEDMLGVALALGAIATLSGPRTPRRLVLAGALASLAILTKPTLLAATLAGTLWLVQLDRRQAALFAGVCFAIVVSTVAVFELSTGAFFANTVFANAVPFRRDAFVENLRTLRHFQTIPLALAGLYLFDCLRKDRRPHADLLVLYWVACLPAVAGFARPGSAHNYWIELAASTAVLATLAAWAGFDARATLPDRLRTLFTVVLLAAGVAYVLRGFGSAAIPVKSVQSLPKAEPDFHALVERMRAEPRKVLADPPDVVVLAGRRNLLELYFSSIRYTEGRLDLDPLIRQICRGDIGLLALRYELGSDARGVYQGYPYWPAPVLAALRDRMEFRERQAGRFLYVPVDPSTRDSRPGICDEAARSR
jgi:hypothetical protein